MNRPVKPTAPPDDARTIFLDLSTPVVAAPPAVDRILEQGSTVHERYRLLELIGEGSISRVFKATDTRQAAGGAPVAIKLLKAPLGHNEASMEALARTVRALYVTDHPHIVRVHECDHDGSTVFLTMELMSAKSLAVAARSAKAALPRDQALKIVSGIGSALEYAHSKNIVHGDLKPGNVLITPSGEAKVIDFGLARIIGRPIATPRATNSTTRGMKVLALTYASPEMLELGEPDPRDDVFALACITWELMTGEHPFKGRIATSAREAGTTLACPSSLTGSEYNALCRALEFNRSKRTLSVRQFLAQLRGSDATAGSSWKLFAGIGAVVLAVLAMVGYFAMKPASNKIVVDSVVPIADTAPTNFPVGTTFRDCAACPLMKVLPSGEFLQGSAPDDPASLSYELPQHNVAIAYPIAVGQYEVTVGQFAQYVADTGAELKGCTTYDGEWRPNSEVNWKNAVESQTAAYPVSCVSWQDAKRFAGWLSQRTHHTYRLPSASEWEYAARGGSAAIHPWSDQSTACRFGNFADQSAAQKFPGWTVQGCADKFVQSAPVGSFTPNALGLYDMLGNVFEWVEDCWAEDYAGAPNDGSARTDADCSQRELRGGSWFTQPDFVRVSYRDRFPIDYRSTSVGFRLIREINE